MKKIKENKQTLILLLTIIIILMLTLINILEIINNIKLKRIFQNNLSGYQNINTEYEEIYNEIEQNKGIETIEHEIGLQKRTAKENEELIELLNIDLDELKQKNSLLEQQLIFQKTNPSNEYIIERKITYNQFPEYPTGCESTALYILLKYHNIEITLEQIINNLKKGELPYNVSGKMYGGNPELEFIGDPENDYSYGVYNEPLKEIALKYKEGIISKTGIEFEDVLNIVKENRPVLVWVTINLIEPHISQTWIYRPTGETIKWISGEHAVVVIGYNDKEVIASDPYTGTIRYFDKETFKERYNFLGKRVLYY